MPPEKLDKLYEQATRIGTFALLVNSVVSLLTNVLVPFFIAPTYDSRPALADLADTEGDASTFDDPKRRSILDKLRIPGFTIRRAWLYSLILFALSMWCTVIVRSVKAATALFGLVGITWGMTLWAPYAIISAEISRRDAILRARKLRNAYAGAANSLPSSGEGESTSSTQGQIGSADDEVDEAGLIMGIHNMAIAAPQMIATLGSSVIFMIWQKPRGTPGDHSMSIVFALGGVFVLMSAFFVVRIQEGGSLPVDVVAEEGDHQTQRPKISSSSRDES